VDNIVSLGVSCYKLYQNHFPVWDEGSMHKRMRVASGHSLVLVCGWPHSVWTKSLVCKDAVLQGILLFRRVLEDSTVRKVGSLSVVRTIVPSRLDDVPYRPDAQTDLASFVRKTKTSVRTLHCIEKLLSHLASVRTSQQPVRTPLSIWPSFRFFPSSFMGRLMQPFGRRGFSSGRASP
jgi:hypothetical protein